MCGSHCSACDCRAHSRTTAEMTLLQYSATRLSTHKPDLWFHKLPHHYIITIFLLQSLELHCTHLACLACVSFFHTFYYIRL